MLYNRAVKQKIRYEPMPYARPTATRGVAVHRFVPIDEDQPDLSPEDGLRPPPFELQLSPRQKLMRAAVVSAFVAMAAFAGAILA